MFDQSYFLVFVPGYTGSVLRDEQAGQTMWVDLSTIAGDIDGWLARMKFPENGISNLKATRVMEQITIINPLTRDEGYMRLWDMFEHVGLRADPGKHSEAELDVHPFPYDWRQDNVKSAEELKGQIEHWRRLHPGREVWVMAHSNGGVVARWYIEQLGGKDVVKKLILLGSPWDGTPKALQMATTGSDFFIGPLNLMPAQIKRMTRELFRTFPSLYQIMPLKQDCLKDADGNAMTCFDRADWLDNPKQREYLAAGKAFTQTLGNKNSVDTVCLYGHDIKTAVGGTVTMNADGSWQDVRWRQTIAGDGTIPTCSGLHENAGLIRGMTVLHTRFHLDEPAVIRLGQILGKMPVDKALATTEHYQVVFTPNRQVYRAGSDMKLTVKVTERATGKRVKGASAVVDVAWAQEIPGDVVPPRVPKKLHRRLAADGNKLAVTLPAPHTQGYYRLTASVTLPAFNTPISGPQPKQSIQLHELVAVQSHK